MQNIIIYLGSKCNQNCQYCHRDNTDDLKLDKKFLSSLSDYKGSITFRGGEPTLYMDTIKEIVEVAKNANFVITTNGILFEKYKNFFYTNNFKVIFSYDGNELRPFDPFTRKIYYPKIMATSILTKDADIHKLVDTFEEKSDIIGHPLEYYPHICHYTTEENKHFAMLEKDYQRIIPQIKDCMKLFVDARRNGVTISKYYGIHRFFIDAYNNNFIFGETNCANRRSKRVDVTGQQYDCLYIRDQKLNDDWLTTQQESISKKFPKCVNCSVYDMCGAGCVKSLYHDKECMFYYNLFTWYKEFRNKYNEFLF